MPITVNKCATQKSSHTRTYLEEDNAKSHISKGRATRTCSEDKGKGKIISPQQISDFDLVSSVKIGQPSQKWSNSKVKNLEVEIGELLSKFEGDFAAILKLD